MMIESVSILSLFGATLASIVIGFIWYGPLFGKEWMALIGWTEEAISRQRQRTMGKSYILMTTSSLVMVFILANFVKLAGAVTVLEGISVGFFAWLGFAVPLLSTEVLWEKKPAKLYLIHIGYHLISFTLMGAILAAWS